MVMNTKLFLLLLLGTTLVWASAIEKRDTSDSSDSSSSSSDETSEKSATTDNSTTTDDSATTVNSEGTKTITIITSSSTSDSCGKSVDETLSDLRTKYQAAKLDAQLALSKKREELHESLVQWKQQHADSLEQVREAYDSLKLKAKEALREEREKLHAKVHEIKLKIIQVAGNSTTPSSSDSSDNDSSSSSDSSDSVSS